MVMREVLGIYIDDLVMREVLGIYIDDLGRFINMITIVTSLMLSRRF